MVNKMTMNAGIKEQWLNALRSGSYRQGLGSLHEDDFYCCLGVMCDLAVKNNVIPEPTQTLSGDFSYGEWPSGGITYLPVAVQEWTGLHTHDPLVTLPNGEVRSLSYLNDEGYTFAQIADLIEEQL